MEDVLHIEQVMTAEQNDAIRETVVREQKRLFNFIRNRVPEEEDAEDILQDVFYQLVQSYRIAEPIEQLSAWLFTVARNKITDWFRKKKAEPISKLATASYDDEDETNRVNLAELLPDNSDGPEALHARKIILSELEEAIDELPEEQREVFVMHEIEDRSFKEISELTGESVNTLLSRKRYAVLYLRKRLREMYNEFKTI